MNKKQVLICGHVGAHPELMLTKNNETILKFSIAERVPNNEKPIWHKIVVWGDYARACKERITKGTHLFIQGIEVNKEFTLNDGIKKCYREINAKFVGVTVS